jgi:hypothetical protein
MKGRSMKLGQVHDIVDGDTLSVKGGIYTYRRGFFYTNGCTSEQCASNILRKLKESGLTGEVIDHGEKWTRFIGGAPLARQSHWWVKFRITGERLPVK